MTSIKRKSWDFAAIVAVLLISTRSYCALPIEKIKLPPGFQISVFSSKVPDARSMAWGKSGTLFVGTRENGNVYAIAPSGKVTVIASGLTMPNGVAVRGDDLFVAEVSRVLKFENIEDHLQNPSYKVIFSGYPDSMHHGWKYIAFGPDGKLFVPVGAPCNICEPEKSHGSMTKLDVDKGTMEIFAKGIRNSVGFDWHPGTKELWFTENGRDNLGDDSPPDELNRAAKAGLHFGYPYCHGGEILDPEYGDGKKCSDYVKPEQNLGPHVAALGMHFYRGAQFPAEFKNQIFIAEHGSWNRSTLIGYRVTLVRLGSNGHAEKYETFAEGWLQNKRVWGRPVALLETLDGSLLISDDKAGAIYKIGYKK